MIPIDLSRTGTPATTPRRDKSAGVGDAFGVQMEKALAARPSDRRGGGDRPHVSAPTAPVPGHAPEVRERASDVDRSTARDASRNSGMEGAGPEPGAPAPFVQAAGLPGAERAAEALSVLADAATVAASAGTVSGTEPAAGASLAGALVAGPVTGEPTVQGLAASAAATQSAATVGGTTAAPQFALQGTEGAAGTVPGHPAAPAVPGKSKSLDTQSPTPSPAQGETLAAAITTTPTYVRAAVAATANAITAASATNASATATAPASPPAGTAAGTAAATADGGQTSQAQPGVVVPASGPAPSAAPGQAAVTGAPAAAQSPAHPPLAAQLSGPLFSLATARAGEHTMTLSVTPENLGPVTVRAHIGAEGVRVELFAPTDAGREALRAILHDLKRDLASAGLGSNLDLSARSGPEDRGAGGQYGGGPGSEAGDLRQLRLPPGHSAAPAPTTHLRFAGTPTGLDVLA